MEERQNELTPAYLEASLAPLQPIHLHQWPQPPAGLHLSREGWEKARNFAVWLRQELLDSLSSLGFVTSLTTGTSLGLISLFSG